MDRSYNIGQTRALGTSDVALQTLVGAQGVVQQHACNGGQYEQVSHLVPRFVLRLSDRCEKGRSKGSRPHVHMCGCIVVKEGLRDNKETWWPADALVSSGVASPCQIRLNPACEGKTTARRRAGHLSSIVSLRCSL